jgi:hypothetical protein
MDGVTTRRPGDEELRGDSVNKYQELALRRSGLQ